MNVLKAIRVLRKAVELKNNVSPVIKGRFL